MLHLSTKISNVFGQSLFKKHEPFFPIFKVLPIWGILILIKKRKQGLASTDLEI